MDLVVWFLLGFLIARDSGSSSGGGSSLDLQPLMDVLPDILFYSLAALALTIGICTFINLFRRH